MRALKESASLSTTHLFSYLTDSFAIYNCDPTPNAYHFVIKTLMKTSQLHQLHPVLDRLEKVENFETPEHNFIDLIEFYGNSNRIQEEIEVFFKIPDCRCKPSVDSLNSLLSVLSNNPEGVKIVPQVVLKGEMMNILMEESSFHVLIKALCRIKKVDYALELLKYMIDDGFDLDGRICSLILSALYEQKDLSVVRFMAYLEELRTFGFCPGRLDWCNVIRLLVKKGKGMDALDVLNQMKVDGIKPDVFCYTMALDGVIREGYYTKADELFDEMLVLGVVPDIYTYNVYLNGLCKQKNVDAGIEMLAHIEEVRCRPDLITYNTILGALCESGELRKAKEVVKLMESKGVQHNLQTYDIVIAGMVHQGEICEACILLEEMVGKHFIPQSSTFFKILCAFCQTGLVSRELEFLTKTID